MRDLEQRIRDVLHDEARSAPPPHDAERAIGRTHRRQVGTVAGTVVGVVALAAASIVALRAVSTTDGPSPADQPIVTTTINGISISHPEGWFVVDPEEAGLNGPDLAPDSEPTLPRLMVAVAPFDPGDLFGCPGQAGRPHAFLMTIQEEPLALAGPDVASWPTELEPLDVGTSESGCYPGWEFLRAGWTASERTFEARIGLAPDVADPEREALVAAFASMTFEPVPDGAASVVLATGTAGGEEWELVATRGTGGLQLMLQAETTGGGGGGGDGTDSLWLTDLVLGEGAQAERVVFGTTPVDIVRIGVRQEPDDELLIDVLEVPDEIDPGLNAFLFTLFADRSATVTAYDRTGEPIATGQIDPLGDLVDAPANYPRPGDYPTASPSPDEVIFRGRTNECEWTLSRASVGPTQERLDLATSDGVSVGFLADIGPDAPAIQLSSYTCSIDPGGTLVFGLYADEVADLRFPSTPPEEHGVPECWPADFPERFCLFLLDGVGDAGEVVALDTNGNEIGRESFL